MDEVDALLMRMRGTAPVALVADDPLFPMQLHASVRRGAMLAVVRAGVAGLAAAAALVLANPLPLDAGQSAGPLLTAADGSVL